MNRPPPKKQKLVHESSVSPLAAISAEQQMLSSPQSTYVINKYKQSPPSPVEENEPLHHSSSRQYYNTSSHSLLKVNGSNKAINSSALSIRQPQNLQGDEHANWDTKPSTGHKRRPHSPDYCMSDEGSGTATESIPPYMRAGNNINNNNNNPKTNKNSSFYYNNTSQGISPPNYLPRISERGRSMSPLALTKQEEPQSTVIKLEVSRGVLAIYVSQFTVETYYTADIGDY